MNYANLRSAITQTWTCAHCRTTERREAMGALVAGVPVNWHDLDGKALCSTRCLALVVLANPNARPHIVAQFAAEAEAAREGRTP